MGNIQVKEEIIKSFVEDHLSILRIADKFDVSGYSITKTLKESGVYTEENIEKVKQQSEISRIEAIKNISPEKRKQMMEKSRATKQERDSHRKAAEKRIQTLRKKYGDPSITGAMQIKELKEKQRDAINRKSEEERQISRKKMSDWWVNLSDEEYEIIEEKKSKKSYLYKTYTFKCGSTIKVQGFEPLALKELEDNGYGVSDIIFRKFHKINGLGKQHRYMADITLSEKTIEVKSTWTFKRNIDKNRKIMNHMTTHGYEFEFWVYDDKKTKRIVKTSEELEELMVYLENFKHFDQKHRDCPLSCNIE